VDYKLIRVYPYTDPQATELKDALAQGWMLHGGPVKGRGDEEYFQAVIKRPGNETPLQEPGRGGSLTKGNPGTISRG
jgi:hypothetical protein